MNRQRVVNIIREPLRMEHEKDLPLIKELIEEFPYFSAPYVLLTKLLSEQKSIYLDKYLKLSASYIGDREVLYNLIHSPVKTPDTTENIVEVNNPVLIENPDYNNISASAEVMHAQNIDSTHITATEKATETAEEKITVPPQDTDTEQNNSPQDIKSIEIENRLGEQSDIKVDITESTGEDLVSEEESTGSEEITQASATEQTDKPFIEEAKVEDKPVEKPDTKSPSFQPLAAYDYFALQEKLHKTKIKAAKEENPQEELAENTAPEIITESAPIAGGKISFATWLGSLSKESTQIPLQQAVGRDQKTTKSTEILHAKTDKKPKREDIKNIIDNFIKTEPRIKPKPTKFFTPQDVAERSAEEDNTLVTETLANIYLKQGLYDKATEIFQQLMLRYPQKSNYFAVRIQEINTKAG